MALSTEYRVLLIAMIIIGVSACATKRYPIAEPMSSAEAKLMTCHDLQLELIRTEEVEDKIDKTGEFNGKTVLGFLGDFGIGNGMAKDEAQKAVSARRSAIREAQVKKGCIGDSSTE